MQIFPLQARRLAALVAAVPFAAIPTARASDHLDTPTVVADPSADIADLYAWTSAETRRLHLVMTIVGHQFSDRLHYAFHVDSGPRFDGTAATVTILCRFDAAGARSQAIGRGIECWAGDADHVRGDASHPAGLDGARHRFRVFAGLRDDPFYNNVKGTRQALNAAAAALQSVAGKGSPPRLASLVDRDVCPSFDAATSQAIFDRWAHSDGGPAINTLAGWTSSSLVISVDLDVVATGGPVLAVWAGTYKP